MNNEEQGRASFNKIISNDDVVNYSKNFNNNVESIGNRENAGFVNATVLIVVIIGIILLGIFLGYMLSK